MTIAANPLIDQAIATNPTTERERIVAIDVLRGFALLGILIMNIRSFAMVEAVYFNPLAAGPMSTADEIIWRLGEVFANMKFMTLFSMLFGAGAVLMSQRRDAAGLPTAGLHYRRMAGLMGIGLVHAYAIWYGDILVTYALCGLWLYPLRKLKAPWLIVLGVALLLVGSGINLFFGWSTEFWPQEELREFETMLIPSTAQIQQETYAYLGSWWRQMSHRAPASFGFQTFIYLVWGLWRAGGAMLIGMALMKLGVFSGKAPRKVWLILIAAALLVGLPLILTGMSRYPINDRLSAQWFFYGQSYNYWGSLFMALGYAGAVMWMCQSTTLLRWLTPLAAVGRTALTNYLAQSIICTLLFYGHGLGLFMKLDWTRQMGVVAAVWVMQLIVSTFWLRRFSMGPMEAAWRAFSYGRWPTMRRQPIVA